MEVSNDKNTDTTVKLSHWILLPVASQQDEEKSMES
jgi:hypothetical protein